MTAISLSCIAPRLMPEYTDMPYPHPASYDPQYLFFVSCRNFLRTADKMMIHAANNSVMINPVAPPAYNRCIISILITMYYPVI